MNNEKSCNSSPHPTLVSIYGGWYMWSLYLTLLTKIEVKKFHYRPGQAQMVPGGWGSKISNQSAHESGKDVIPTHRPPLPPRKYSSYPFLLEAESTPRATVRPEGLSQWKTPITIGNRTNDLPACSAVKDLVYISDLSRPPHAPWSPHKAHILKNIHYEALAWRRLNHSLTSFITDPNIRLSNSFSDIVNRLHSSHWARVQMSYPQKRRAKFQLSILILQIFR